MAMAEQGACVNLLYLVEQGLLDIPVLYLSRHTSSRIRRITYGCCSR